MLLYYLGEPALDIYETLPDTGDAKDYKKAHEALTTYFVPKKNTSVETFKFRNAKQQVTESIDQYHTRLQKLAKHCQFADTEKEIKAQIELGTTSKKLRRHAFRTPDLSLADMLQYGRTYRKRCFRS